MQSTEQLLEEYTWAGGRIQRDEWDYSTNTSDEPSVVATFDASRPVVLREDREVDLAIPAHETFTTNGTADDTETFTVSYDLLDSPATEGLVLFEDGDPVQPDTVDYAADSFDYTDSGTDSTLDVYYIPRNPASVEFRKVAPGGGQTLRQPLSDIPTAIAHTRDQSKEPLDFDLGRSPLHGVVPRKWSIQMVVDAPYNVEFEEDNRGTSATNALLSLPRLQTESRITGLKDAVKRDIAGV